MRFDYDTQFIPFELLESGIIEIVKYNSTKWISFVRCGLKNIRRIQYKGMFWQNFME